MYLIAYIFIALVVMQRTFIAIVRHQIEEWGEVDIADVTFFSIFAFFLGAIWPMTVLIYTIYRYVLEPLVEKINKEGK